MQDNLHPEEDNTFKKADLLLRDFQGELSPEESQELAHWLAEDKANQRFAERLQEKESLEEELSFFSAIDTEAAWQKVAGKTIQAPVTRSLWDYTPYLKYAAAILVVLLSAVWFFKLSHATQAGNPVAQTTTATTSQDVKPGSYRAQLALANGQVIQLEKQVDGLLWNQQGMQVTKKGNQIHVAFTKSFRSSATKGINSLTTPTGGQYQVTLPDGSQVWLNAASTLSFSNNFLQHKREVSLSGEAYFEVAKNKHKPFVVNTKGTSVKVLGTHFNVMAYPEEQSINTTLLEGSVQVANSTCQKMIVPGQQAQVNTCIKISEVDVEAAVAWKNGLFYFQNTELPTILRQLERWYGVKIANQNQIPDQHFTGMISRDTNLSNVLHMLQLTGNINFKLQNNQLLVLHDTSPKAKNQD